MTTTSVSPETLAARAAYILRGNDTGELTTAAPQLYPHLWSWDAAFVAIGLATLSVPRAIAELRTLLRAQWRTGMLPHIVFGPDQGYFPGPDVWDCGVAAAAPAGVQTSGICQPPVHAIAVRRVLDAGRRNGGADRELAERFAAETFDQWLAWHRWLATARDPSRRGLLEIFHGWESGMDNSPRWDRAYSAVVPGAHMPVDRRHDLQHVADAGQRPTDEEYQRYLWLMHQMHEARYDDDAVRETVDFRVTDVFMSGVAALASEVLAELGDEFGRRAEADELRELAARFRAGVLSAVSPQTGLARDEDVRTGERFEVLSVGGFAPLLCGGDPAVTAHQLDLLTGPQWCGHPDLLYAVPPSTAPAYPGFQARTYWRGPQWPFLNWLLWWALRRHGATGLATKIRAEALRQLSDLAFGEYYEPFTGEALGSAHQSWTAAVALDWLLAAD
ncbi:glucosylglycerate hydrolase [Dactylosporangium sp. CA-092794]|uniref:glucosylglycerate hydrolase n=1 Tax=Dactylosporangium sp. CA-092794 TaxID=3239929 RepID=UPI003D91C319